MFEFKLPDLGEGIHEGQVVNVLVAEGDTIAEYQPMLEVETDKAAVEIPSPKAGVVSIIHVKAGDVVKVGQVLIGIEEAGASAAGKATPNVAQRATQVAPLTMHEVAAQTTGKMPVPQTAPVPTPVRPATAGPVAAAPAIRKLARDLKIDISTVPGSGPSGRILRVDVERFAAGHQDAPAQAAAPSLPPVTAVGGELPDFSQYGPIRREKASQIRRTIARQMTRAWASVPRVTHCDNADVTDLEHNRKQYNTGLKEGRAKLTMTAIAIKAVAVALHDFPVLNSSYDAAAEEIIYKDYVHIGIAVDSPRGLVVPVLHDADRKSLPQIAAELQELGERVRTVKFEITDLRGATFTITNVGALGGTFVTPMVNYPEVGILGLGRAQLQPAVREGQVVTRMMLPLSLSFDHRVVDGAVAARFTSEVIGSLENPLRLISLA